MTSITVSYYRKVLTTYLSVNYNFYILSTDSLASNNVLGFSQREAKLAQRVREVEEQNQLLRNQLRFEITFNIKFVEKEPVDVKSLPTAIVASQMKRDLAIVACIIYTLLTV